MKTIFKYTMTKSPLLLLLPPEAQILSCQEQAGHIQLWALVDEDSVDDDPRLFTAYNTGQSIPDNPGTYIATVQRGSYVTHIFES